MGESTRESDSQIRVGFLGLNILAGRFGNMGNYHDINVPDSDDNTRFSQMVDEEELKTRKLTRVPKSTRNSNDWGVNSWRE